MRCNAISDIKKNSYSLILYCLTTKNITMKWRVEIGLFYGNFLEAQLG